MAGSTNISNYTAGAQSFPARATLEKASLLETLAVATDVVLPTLAKGVIIRRPGMLGMADRLDLDHRAIRRMQRVRDRHGRGPLLMQIAGRRFALLLDPQHVSYVLDKTPEPFATATKEKRAALAHFEPKGVLISHEPERAERRRYNEEILDTNRPAHRLAGSFLPIVDSEAKRLFGSLKKNELGWQDFSAAWFRMVRRILCGEAASEDHELSSIMAKLRSAANWAFLVPQRTGLRDQLLRRIDSYVARADASSLAGVMAHTGSSRTIAASQQVPQWLFAFDAAGMTTFRSLALLASHRTYGRRVREEIEIQRGAARQQLPLTRAAVLESLRLWPTTPLILRESTQETTWDTGVLPANTAVLIFVPFFHRDSERLPYADRFTPELWKDDVSQHAWPVISFSAGSGVCPGRPLVLLLASAMIAAILDNARVRLKDTEQLGAGIPLPATLNHFKLKFELRAVSR